MQKSHSFRRIKVILQKYVTLRQVVIKYVSYQKTFILRKKNLSQAESNIFMRKVLKLLTKNTIFINIISWLLFLFFSILTIMALCQPIISLQRLCLVAFFFKHFTFSSWSSLIGVLVMFWLTSWATAPSHRCPLMSRLLHCNWSEQVSKGLDRWDGGLYFGQRDKQCEWIQKWQRKVDNAFTWEKYSLVLTSLEITWEFVKLPVKRTFTHVLYKFQVDYCFISILCYFIRTRHYNSEGTTVVFTRLHLFNSFGF